MPKKIKMKRLTEMTYKIISSLIQEVLEDLENRGLENTVEYDQLEKAQQEIESHYW